MTIPTHRICQKCGNEKFLSEFGLRRSNSDNIDNVCKACRRENTRQYGSQWQQQEPWSTKEARKLLSIRHIPCVTGRDAGLPKIDLVAWACVPIEAKSSRPTYITQLGTHGFEFAFSRSQRNHGVPGLIILFARIDDEKYRWFVVPGNRKEIIGKGHLCVTIDSPNSKTWAWLKDFENKLDLVEDMRLQFAKLGYANEYRP